MLFAIKNLRKQRLQDSRNGFVLQVPSFVIRRGDKILLTGPSGSGKSTLLDMLGLVLRPDAGGQFAIQLARQPVDIMQLWQQRQMEELAELRRHMGYVLQTGGLLPFLSARQNIALAFKMQREANHRLLPRIAVELNIEHLLDKLPAQLSVGERQRVAIARAIVRQPVFILADEPTAALDPAHAEKVMGVFTRMVEEMGLTLFLVTHDLSKALSGFRHFIIAHELEPDSGLTQGVLHEVQGAG